MSTENPNDRGALSLLIDLDSHDAAQMQELTLASTGLKERSDLQRWITEHPDLIAPGLLLITTEFDRWEVRHQKVADRLDALFLDTSGAPVVVELKRDKATDTVELQALKYAAYCSQLTLDELAEEYATTHGGSGDEGRQRLLDHAPALEDGGLRSVRILLVAGSFGPAVTSVVLWLREYEVDIGCVEVSGARCPRRDKQYSRHARSCHSRRPRTTWSNDVTRSKRRISRDGSRPKGAGTAMRRAFPTSMSPWHAVCSRSSHDTLTSTTWRGHRLSALGGLATSEPVATRSRS